MKVQDKIGLSVSVAITMISVVFVFSGFAITTADSIQSQGEIVIDKTTNEIKEVPGVIESIADETIDNVQEIPEQFPTTLEDVSDKIEQITPDTPIVVKQQQGTLIKNVVIPEGTSFTGCEKINSCYIPPFTTIGSNGIVIWENQDDVAHTVTSGNSQDGPDGLFDSGIIIPGDTYAQDFKIKGYYDYFCTIHPWMQGNIWVK